MGIADPDTSCSDVFNRAFVVTTDDLKHLYDAGSAWTGSVNSCSPHVWCEASLRDCDERLRSDSVTSIVQHTNPRRQQIERISMRMVSEQKDKTFRVVLQDQEHPALIQLEIGGPHIEETERLFRKVSAELLELTQWYSPLACRRWVRKALTWAWWFLIVLSVGYLGLSLAGSACRQHLARKRLAELQRRHPALFQEALKNASKAKESRPDIRADDEEVPSAEADTPGSLALIWHLVWNADFLLGVGIVIGGVGMERITRYLFPTAVFEIGKGKDRHDRLKATRKWLAGILTTLLIAGFILPKIKRFLS